MAVNLCEVELISSVFIAVGVCSHYILQPSSALSLLLKPVTSRELLLPCSLPPPSTQSPEPDASQTVQVGHGNCRRNIRPQKQKRLCVLKNDTRKWVWKSLTTSINVPLCDSHELSACSSALEFSVGTYHRNKTHVLFFFLSHKNFKLKIDTLTAVTWVVFIFFLPVRPVWLSWMKSLCSTPCVWAVTCTRTWGEGCRHSHGTRTGQKRST